MREHHGSWLLTCAACSKEGPSGRFPADVSDAALLDGWRIVRAERPSIPSSWLCPECADRRKLGGYLHRIGAFALPDGFTIHGVRTSVGGSS